MKKFLSLILSTALMASLAAVPAVAQHARKAKGVPATCTAVTMKAEPRDTRAPKNLDGFQTPRFKTARTKGLIENTGLRHIAPRVKRTVEGTVSDMPQIYGSLMYSSEWDEAQATAYGVYTIPVNAGQPFQMAFTTDGRANFSGACKDGVYYMNHMYDMWGFIKVFDVRGYDVETGEEVYKYIADHTVFAPGGMALDPLTNEIYGIFYNENGNGYELASVSYDSEPPVKTTVAPLYGSWVAFSVTSDGSFYGIRLNDSTKEGELCKIDRTSAEVTFIGGTGHYPYYQSGSCIDAKTNRMFWAVNPEDGSGYLTEVNLSTGATEVVCIFEHDEEVTGMYVLAPAAADKAPGSCTVVKTMFDGKDLTGYMDVTAPEKLFDGSDPAGKLDLHVAVDGEVIASTTGVDYGENARLDLDLTSKGGGLYTFVVYAENSEGEGPKTKIKNFWVGADIPESPEASLAYVNGNMEVTWKPVTTSVNGGYIDLENLTYTVKRADGSVAAEGITGTSFAEAVAEPDPITYYHYEVEAVSGDMVSAPGKTNTVVLGSIDLPYNSSFTDNGFDGWTVIDGNEDGKVWTVYGSEARMAYNVTRTMNDWLVTPPVKLEAQKAYRLSFSARAHSKSYHEIIEVKMGRSATADGMTETLLAPADLTSATPTEFDIMIMPEENGTYFIGFHGMSDPDQYYLYLSDITIETGVSALTPGAVSDLEVTPDPSGALKANVSFKAPALTMNNEPLSSLSKVEILREEKVVKTFDTPQPGASLSFDDTLTEGGHVTYTVVGYNGHGSGLKATASVFVGFDIPEAPASAALSRTQVDGEALISWEPVTRDINGLTYPADGLTYSVYNVTDTDSPKLLAEGLKTTSYSYQAAPDGEQGLFRYAVFAVADAGTSQGTMTTMDFIGTPLAGLHETGDLEQSWMILSIGNGKWGLYNEESLGIPAYTGMNYLACASQRIDEGGELISPRVSLAGMDNPGVTFYTYNLVGEVPDENQIEVFVREDGETEYTPLLCKTVSEICTDGVEDWGRATASLRKYAGKVVQIKFVALTKQYVYTLLDNIKVGDILAHDLVATGITAPEKVMTGTDYTVDVSVTNDGAQDADAYTVELYADGELAESKECGKLAASARTTVGFNRAMSAIADVPVVYHARIIYSGDENPENNITGQTKVAPEASGLATATDLKGENRDEGISLTWTEPDPENGTGIPVTDGFEDGNAFTSEYGDWTFVDMDGSTVGGFQNIDIPGITPGETTGSFWIWDQSVLGNSSFEAHSGTKYMFALFNQVASGQELANNNDWAISPELSGKPQTVSFYARSYDATYPERMSIYYSTKGKETSDFVKIEGAGSDAVPGAWTLFEAALPDGAKYFAIVCESYDSFMLMVDDVKYVPANWASDLSVAGYNVYRDGIRINAKTVETTSFVDGDVTEGEQYTYVVTAVYKDNGESIPSNEAVITRESAGVSNLGHDAVDVSTDGNNIVILNADGLHVSIASADGALIFNHAGEARMRVPAVSGVYVVKAGNTVRKLVVR